MVCFIKNPQEFCFEKNDFIILFLEKSLCWIERLYQNGIWLFGTIFLLIFRGSFERDGYLLKNMGEPKVSDKYNCLFQEMMLSAPNLSSLFVSCSEFQNFLINTAS